MNLGMTLFSFKLFFILSPLFTSVFFLFVSGTAARSVPPLTPAHDNTFWLPRHLSYFCCYFLKLEAFIKHLKWYRAPSSSELRRAKWLRRQFPRIPVNLGAVFAPHHQLSFWVCVGALAACRWSSFYGWSVTSVSLLWPLVSPPIQIHQNIHDI